MSMCDCNHGRLPCTCKEPIQYGQLDPQQRLDVARGTPQPAGQAVEVAGEADVERQIVGRYTVHPTGRGFWPYCVRAGDGERELFVGHKRKCDEVAAALQAACLDGAFMQAAMLAAAPQTAQQPNPDVARLREALSHIIRTCQGSRTRTRRLRWIEQRAQFALEGKPYSDDAFDLPKDATGSNEKLRAKVKDLHSLLNRVRLNVTQLQGMPGLLGDIEAALAASTGQEVKHDA